MDGDEEKVGRPFRFTKEALTHKFQSWLGAAFSRVEGAPEAFTLLGRKSKGKVNSAGLYTVLFTYGASCH